jgi:hypothetical protein
MKRFSTTTTPIVEIAMSSQRLCDAVTRWVTDANFCAKHKTRTTPLAMVAFAEAVAKHIIVPKVDGYFDRTLMLEVPPYCHSWKHPHYHSIVGQKLLLVNWEKTFGLTVPCPDSNCAGTLKNDRTNYSKNKTLFPIFGLDGAPAWSMVKSMVCSDCKRRFDANQPEVLVQLPCYAAEAYPVETRFAFPSSQSHLSRTATETFDAILC